MLNLGRLLALAGVLFLAGCASSPYTYYVEPTPIKQGVTTYLLGDVTVNLSLGQGAIAGDTTFASQDILAQQFTAALQKYLKEKNLLAQAGGDKTVTVNIEIDYKRTFNYGGKALNKPQVSHWVVVQKDGRKLASFGSKNYTTKYAYLKELAVLAEIAAFSWDEEDEPEDVNLIAELIIEDLAELGG